MISIIRIQDLEMEAIIGINPEERENPQEIVINVCLEYDAEVAIQNDDIKDALDYKTLTKKIIH
ncbi:FolB domain-containing protein, partial [PVC group bacterium]|nr:FolB domain-containing protein [PVC group bacterium]